MPLTPSPPPLPVANQAATGHGATSDFDARLRDLQARFTDRGIVITLHDMRFESGASSLRSGPTRCLERLADFFKHYPDQHASIEGYTDNVGPAKTNQILSNRRAHAVMAALIDMGVPSDHLRAQAFGEDYPAASNRTARGRTLNRRVEVVLDRDPRDLLAP